MKEMSKNSLKSNLDPTVLICWSKLFHQHQYPYFAQTYFASTLKLFNKLFTDLDQKE